MTQPDNDKQESVQDDNPDADLDLDLELDELELDLESPAVPDSASAGSPAGLGSLDTPSEMPAPEMAASENTADEPEMVLEELDLDTPETGAKVVDAPMVGTALQADDSVGAAAVTGGAPAHITAPAGGSAEVVAESVTKSVATPQPAVGDAGAASAANAQAGQWVWQFAAAPPPPPFSAVFFSGTALKEKYRFFACGMLAVLGCLFPWQAGVVGVEGSLPGFMIPIGAACMALSLWLVWASCTSIYARKPMILPAFLMLIPAAVTWVRMLDAWGAADTSLAFGEQINQVLYSMGTGVMLTLFGSTVVALQFVLTLGKVMGSKKEPATGRASKAKSKDKKAKTKKPKAEKKPKPDKQAAAKGEDAGKAPKGRRDRRR